MGRINRANLKKTIYYLKRNGIKNTWYAVLERLDERKQPPYIWNPPPESRLAEQRAGWQRARQTRDAASLTFSILVPVYRTKPEYLRELLDSLRAQTYPWWEVILADATEDDSVEQMLRGSSGPGEVEFVGSGQGGLAAWDFSPTLPGGRIRYIHLEKNAGIAENTNQALPYAAGDYIGLLDHDDILTPDALHEMAAAIGQERERGLEPAFLYSDEDKCNGDRTEYFEPNFKEDFNLDLLLSNNYICHFLVMKRELMQELGFRPEYDGAQDFDLVLRAAARLKGREQDISHIPKVLYHWRCHPGSTAENPQSKRHAYEAGRRAVQDFADGQGWRVRAVDTAHVGFYSLRYEGDIFESRTDIGAVGGRVVGRGRVADRRVASRDGAAAGRPGYNLPRGRGKIVGGRMSRDGQVLYEGLPVHYSGYLHRAVLSQDAEAVDLRNIRVRPECRELFRQITGIDYRTMPGTDRFDVSQLPEGSDICALSLKLCEALRKEGYRILYLPVQDFDAIPAECGRTRERTS